MFTLEELRLLRNAVNVHINASCKVKVYDCPSGTEERAIDALRDHEDLLAKIDELGRKARSERRT